MRKIIWVLIFCAFWWMGYNRLDPDFGQHLQTGKLILLKGIPKTDPFSYTMPSFPYIDHAWLTDVWWAWVYPVIGKNGLAAIYAGIALLAAWLVVPKKLRKYADVPLLFTLAMMWGRGGVRPQVFDWLMVAIVMRAVGTAEDWKKYRWWLPLMFVAWTNLHGGYVLGLGIVGLSVLGRWYENRKIRLVDAVPVVLCIAATGVNPYGFKVWEEVWLTMSDSNLRNTIMEWQPFWANADLGFWLLTGLAVAFVKYYFKKIEIWKLVMIAVVFWTGVTSIRNMVMLGLVALPVMAALQEKFYIENIINNEAKKRLKMIYPILIGIAGFIFLFGVVSEMVITIRSGQSITYPEKAVEYLKQANYSGQLFSEYGWGGYLIWKYPEKKTFVDGRMPSWRWTPPTDAESAYAFKDYLKITYEGEDKDYFDKYKVGVVLWPAKPLGENKLTEYVDNLLARFWEKNNGIKNPNFLENLKNRGWEKVYEDKVSVVYVRPDEVK